MEEEREQADLGAELKAMADLSNSLKDLPAPSQKRVLEWALSAFEIKVQSTPASRASASQQDASGSDEGAAPAGQDTFTSFADLFGDAAPQSDAERALVGGYWLQVVQGQEDFTSQSVNEELKNTGNAVGNITRAFDSLKNTKPQLIRQLLKAGRSQQARKKLKLTTAGMDRVKQMLTNNFN